MSYVLCIRSPIGKLDTDRQQTYRCQSFLGAALLTLKTLTGFSSFFGLTLIDFLNVEYLWEEMCNFIFVVLVGLINSTSISGLLTLLSYHFFMIWTLRAPTHTVLDFNGYQTGEGGLNLIITNYCNTILRWVWNCFYFLKIRLAVLLKKSSASISFLLSVVILMLYEINCTLSSTYFAWT